MRLRLIALERHLAVREEELQGNILQSGGGEIQQAVRARLLLWSVEGIQCWVALLGNVDDDGGRFREREVARRQGGYLPQRVQCRELRRHAPLPRVGRPELERHARFVQCPQHLEASRGPRIGASHRHVVQDHRRDHGLWDRRPRWRRHGCSRGTATSTSVSRRAAIVKNTRAALPTKRHGAAAQHPEPMTVLVASANSP
mmetsp:Transcript_44881/g.113609  ORF Transcript_44881/g.113609 Transcript_44881/m.113609 type:complete len:200 (-) Transcript_44881:186-785(-)